MIDPCEKERKEYQLALDEEIKAKEKVDTILKPLGKGTPPPSNINDIVIWKEKEKVAKEKRQALDDCEKKYKT